MDDELRTAVRTMALVGRKLERAAAPLTLPQYRVLTLIAHAPERASRLAQRADVTKATLTGVIDALVTHGWIERSDVAGDRRGVSLALTLDGATVLEQAEAKMCAWLSEVLALVGREASDHVTTAMATLGEALAAHRETREAAPVVG
jgi:DNA-binding MarR family transcriptional regulator